MTMKVQLPEKPTDLFGLPYWYVGTDGGGRYYITKHRAVYHLGPRPHHVASKLSGATHPAEEKDRGAPWQDEWAMMEYSPSGNYWYCTGRAEGWDALKDWKADVFGTFREARAFTAERLNERMQRRVDEVRDLAYQLGRLEATVDDHHR